MTWQEVADALAALCLTVGSLLALIAAIGVVRFPDVLTRMHSATKPQVLGLMLILLGVGLRLRDPASTGILLLVAVFQLVTTPIGSHMVGRASLRGDLVRRDQLVVDELSEVQEGAPRPGDRSS